MAALNVAKNNVSISIAHEKVKLIDEMNKNQIESKFVCENIIADSAMHKFFLLVPLYVG